ncbi:tRNA glutamyl-Q(34) synthetase GluQRS [Pelagibius sp.]|uniref:tRNA glutamyl-Q(34) synthetase GluQRS n=1 Tax=Pelagibius sp. TaxID=1931238 RepID=UPI002636A8F1|nr:tRNA glutamyl-Q(34) synthetase GluQRS [Pelagibius sp.]
MTTPKVSASTPAPGSVPGGETTRFAPSPSGYLHLGHAFSAFFAARAAGAGGRAAGGARDGAGGRFLLRIEDIDGSRARPEYEAAILEDLAWLGLQWEEPLRRQSDCTADYAAALQRLEARGVLYPCFCTRKEIAAEIARAGAAPHGPPGRGEAIYPGICRGLTNAERRQRSSAGERYALRLNMTRALAEAEAEHGGPLTWHDRARGQQVCDPRPQGDVVLARKDAAASYHLAVVVDDAAQGVTLVTRGEDLFAASHVHRLLQALLDLPVPEYHHHGLVGDEAGRRLAKRHDGLSIRHLREAGRSAGEVIALAENALLPSTAERRKDP